MSLSVEAWASRSRTCPLTCVSPSTCDLSWYRILAREDFDSLVNSLKSSLSKMTDYIMLELLKNSMRATVEFHGIDADFPPIKVVIADGAENEDVVIKVSDEGGGIPRSNIKKIWSYLFTTADPSVQEGMVGTQNDIDHGTDSPLAGLGYGLPISRSYAQYFGGDLSIMSMEGYGTDAFVYLARLGNTKEPVPI